MTTQKCKTIIIIMVLRYFHTLTQIYRKFISGRDQFWMWMDEHEYNHRLLQIFMKNCRLSKKLADELQQRKGVASTSKENTIHIQLRLFVDQFHENRTTNKTRVRARKNRQYILSFTVVARKKDKASKSYSSWMRRCLASLGRPFRWMFGRRNKEMASKWNKIGLFHSQQLRQRLYLTDCKYKIFIFFTCSKINVQRLFR